MAGPPSNGLPFLRVALTGAQKRLSTLEIEAWLPSEVRAISPLVDQLMQLIEGSHCVADEEREVELALHEALSNAVIHGNRMDAEKLVHIQCHLAGLHRLVGRLERPQQQTINALRSKAG